MHVCERARGRLTLALAVLDDKALRAAGDAAALVQAGRGGTGRTVFCRWPRAQPAGGMALWEKKKKVKQGTVHTHVMKKKKQAQKLWKDRGAAPLLCPLAL